MSTSYRPIDPEEGFSTFELLAVNPQTLSRFASYCAKEFSGENLLAFLLLQYIDCRASAGHDVGDEFNVLYRDFVRVGSDLELNLASELRREVSGCLFNVPNREFRGKLFDALAVNLGDTWKRYCGRKSHPDAGFPVDFRNPRTISGLDIWKAYLEARRILGKGPHPAGPNRVQKLVRKLRGHWGR